MSIGDLRHRITFQRFATVVNENGFEIEAWKDYMQKIIHSQN
ncbi:phage head completion protein [Clostridium cagae]